MSFFEERQNTPKHFRPEAPLFLSGRKREREIQREKMKGWEQRSERRGDTPLLPLKIDGGGLERRHAGIL